MAETNGVHTSYNLGPISARRSTLPNKGETPEKEQGLVWYGSTKLNPSQELELSDKRYYRRGR